MTTVLAMSARPTTPASAPDTPPQRPSEAPPDPPAIARRILRALPMAALATRAAATDGWPYASLVALATGHDGMPVLLLSRLSDHTRNLDADDRASLLLDNTSGLANRMAGERLTLQGHVRPLDEEHREPLRRRYLARHPGAAAYEGFADFAYRGFTITRAHLIGGFAKAYWLDAREFMPRLPAGYALEAAEPGILAHMNDDHRDAIDHYARTLAGRAGDGWRMSGIDLEGIDLRRSGETARVGFDAPVHDAASARAALVALAERARRAVPEPRGGADDG